MRLQAIYLVEDNRDNADLFIDLLSVLQEAIEEQGVPEYIRSDNGPEFIAKIIQQWLRENNIKALYIDPGKSLEEWIRRELQRPL